MNIYIIFAIICVILVPIGLFGMIYLMYIRQMYDIFLSEHRMIRAFYEEKFDSVVQEPDLID